MGMGQAIAHFGYLNGHAGCVCNNLLLADQATPMILDGKAEK
jgi:hypothetical protein